MNLDVAVIGAGFCGLGTGAALRASGVTNFAIFEQGREVGHFWTKTYDRIHLHSAYHDLPNDGGLRRGYPIFLSKRHLLAYFAEYAEHHRLAPHLRFETRVERVARTNDSSWTIDTNRGPIVAKSVVVATATNRVPSLPAIPGAELAAHALHSSAYRNAQPFVGRSVLVIGSGNSAAEISVDLCEGGARSVAMWVRGPRHFLPLSRLAMLFRVFRALGQLTPQKLAAMHVVTRGTPEFERMVNQRDRILTKLSVDLSRHGIRKPADGPTREMVDRGRLAVFDVGAIAKIRSGAIRVIDGNRRPIEALTETGVRFGDGEERFDTVILATGFKPGLTEFIADTALLGTVAGREHWPLTDRRCRSRVDRHIFFPGFDVTPLGGVSHGRWGWEVGECIARDLG
jgi:indole-3-pyruvate monooxygenase